MVTLVHPGALDQLDAIARSAGAAIMATYGDTTVVAWKAGDQGPLTAADQAAHRVITDALAAWTPAIPIISEEGDLPPHAVRRNWARFWLVDPLDGTKEYLQRNGEFTVNVALIEGTAPALGVVYAPARDLMYLAGAGLGAWRQEGGGPRVRLASAAKARGEPLVVAESRSHPSPALEEYLATIPVARRVPVGSSLKFCAVAEGTADIYPRFGPTMEWDSAAGDCIYRNSGRDGPRPSPLVYNTAALRNDHFVIGT